MKAASHSELIAVVSRDQVRGDSVGEKFGVDRIHTRYQDMLEDPDVDAVYISTPNHLHAEQIIQAAEAQKHILSEKPMALSSLDAVEVLTACEEASVLLGVNFHHRFMPWVADVSAALEKGAIGQPMSATIGVGAGSRAYDNWRVDPAIAGLGTTHNIGVHAFDLLRVLFGCEPVEVMAMFDHAPDGKMVEQLATVLLRFENGALVICDCDEVSPVHANDLIVHGMTGRITVAGLTRSRSEGTVTIETSRTSNTVRYSASQSHVDSLASFVESIKTGEQHGPSGLDGLRSAELCEAIAASAIDRGRSIVARQLP